MEKFDMEITPEREQLIKAELIRQFEDQYGVELTIENKKVPSEPA